MGREAGQGDSPERELETVRPYACRKLDFTAESWRRFNTSGLREEDSSSMYSQGARDLRAPDLDGKMYTPSTSTNKSS